MGWRYDYDGGITTYTRDAVGNLLALVNPQGQTTATVYDPLNRRFWQTLGNGVTTTYGYHPGGRLVGIFRGGYPGWASLQIDEWADLTPDQWALMEIAPTIAYGYDNAGNRVWAVESAGATTTWTYDASYQLASEQRSDTGFMGNNFQAAYTYDPAGNRLYVDELGVGRTTYTHDQANQMLLAVTPSGTISYSYDPCGNQTLVDDLATGSYTAYVWDETGRMAEATPVAGTVSMIYDARGKRVSKDVGGTVTGFLYDFDRLLKETDGAGDTETTFTSTDQGWGELVSEYEQGGDTYYHTFDGLGSTDTLYDEASPTPYAYRSFGAVTEPSGTPGTHFNFVGRENYYHDTELDLYLAGLRYYNPDQGRFTSQDPKGLDAGDANLYRYVGNNPVMKTDPSGEQDSGETTTNVPMERIAGIWELAEIEGRQRRSALVQKAQAQKAAEDQFVFAHAFRHKGDIRTRNYYEPHTGINLNELYGAGPSNNIREIRHGFIQDFQQAFGHKPTDAQRDKLTIELQRTDESTTSLSMPEETKFLWDAAFRDWESRESLGSPGLPEKLDFLSFNNAYRERFGENLTVEQLGQYGSFQRAFNVAVPVAAPIAGEGFAYGAAETVAPGDRPLVLAAFADAIQRMRPNRAIGTGGQMAHGLIQGYAGIAAPLVRMQFTGDANTIEEKELFRRQFEAIRESEDPIGFLGSLARMYPSLALAVGVGRLTAFAGQGLGLSADVANIPAGITSAGTFTQGIYDDTYYRLRSENIDKGTANRTAKAVAAINTAIFAITPTALQGRLGSPHNRDLVLRVVNEYVAKTGGMVGSQNMVTAVSEEIARQIAGKDYREGYAREIEGAIKQTGEQLPMLALYSAGQHVSDSSTTSFRGDARDVEMLRVPLRDATRYSTDGIENPGQETFSSEQLMEALKLSQHTRHSTRVLNALERAIERRELHLQIDENLIGEGKRAAYERLDSGQALIRISPDQSFGNALSNLVQEGQHHLQWRWLSQGQERGRLLNWTPEDLYLLDEVRAHAVQDAFVWANRRNPIFEKTPAMGRLEGFYAPQYVRIIEQIYGYDTTLKGREQAVRSLEAIMRGARFLPARIPPPSTGDVH